MGKSSKVVKNKRPKQRIVQRTKEHVDWKTHFDHEDLRGRTTDPEALMLGLARELFKIGLGLGRMGNLEQASAHIAQAYLVDPRSINFLFHLPPGEEEEAGEMVLDAKLLQQLSSQAKEHIDTHIMCLIICRFNGGDKKEKVIREVGLTIAGELLSLVVGKSPVIKLSLFGDGYNQPRLLLELAHLHITLEEYDEAAEYLSQAVEIDPCYLPARTERAFVWATKEMKDDATVFAEFEELVELLHKDNPWLSPVYAHLALMALKNPKLGTVQEAEQYFDKCLRSIKRRQELYGKTMKSNLAIFDECKTEFVVYWNGPPQRRKVREGLDAAVQAALATDDGGGVVPTKKPLLRSCLTCGTTAEDDVDKVLLNCNGCCKVAYCSKKCQLADWDEHKEFCKMHMTRKKSRNDAKDQAIVSLTKNQEVKITNDNEGIEATPTSEPANTHEMDDKADNPVETESDFAGLD